MSEAYKVASETAQRNAQRGKKQYDKKVRNIVLMPGDRVLVRNMSERGGTGMLRAYWKDEVHVVVKQKDKHIPVRPESGPRKSRVLHRNLLLPCTYLPVDESNFKEPRSGRGDSTPLQQQVTDPEQPTGEPEDHEDEVLSFAPDQLQYCAQAHTPEHTHTRNDTVGDTPLDFVEEVAVQPCDDASTADIHATTSEPANEETKQYQAPDTCTTAESRPQRIRRAPVPMTYDIPGQPVYYPAVTTNLHSASVAPNPVPVWFGMTPPYQPVWYWPPYTVPFQPMYITWEHFKKWTLFIPLF